MPTAPPSPSSRIGALDAVRGVAIIAVIATHSLSAVVGVTGGYNVPTALFKVFSFGEFGVQLFFVLSGWLIFSLYWGDRPFGQKAYWARRWARIWPLWALFVVLSFVAYQLPDSGYPTVVALLLSLFFLGWLSPALVAVPLGGLTIQQEMGHYTLFSLFRRRGVTFLAGTVVVGYLSKYAAQAVLSVVGSDSVIGWLMEAWLRLALFGSWPFFLLGGAGYVTVHLWQTRGVTGIVPSGVAAPTMLLVAFLLGSLSMYSQEIPGYFVLGYVVLCSAVALVGNRIPAVGPSLRSIGRYSYFMYFFHFWVLRFFEARYRDAGLQGDGTDSMAMTTALLFAVTFGTVVVSWAVGYVSWRVLEKPILDIAHRRVPNPKRTPTPAA